MEKKRISFMGKLEVIADFKPTACNMCDFIALDQREVDCPHCCSLTGKRIYRTDARPPKDCPVRQRKGRKNAFRANGNAAAWLVYGMGTSRNYGMAWQAHAYAYSRERARIDNALDVLLCVKVKETNDHEEN